jgi:hypothetical protein
VACKARTESIAAIRVGSRMIRDGLVRASVIARRLNLTARTVRRWVRLGYIEGVYRRSYWVMVRDGRITIVNDKVKIGDLSVR